MHRVPLPRAPFDEITPALTADQAAQESARCLYCYDAPCISACPTHIDIPTFIKKIGTGNLVGSARTIFEANILGGSCARVCPVEVLCEGACVEKTLVKRPIPIGRLQRFATDYALSRGLDLLSAGAATGRSVGIIGAGPAGLGAAAELRRAGHGVVIYDERRRGGGLNTYGMAEYKQTAALAIAEVEMVARLGAEIRQGVTIGKDLTIDQLLQAHDALFVGIGLGATNRLGVPGEELPHVKDALSWIEALKTDPDRAPSLAGKRAVVIGGGNTAIDAVTQARRLGAEATLVYRRGEAQLSAYRYEVELARGMGCTLLFNRPPVRVEARGLVVQEPGQREELLPAELVLAAVGQGKRVAFLREMPGVRLDDRGRLRVDPETFRTDHPRIWAGGDCVNGGKEAVNAVAEGKAAAQSMARELGERPQGPALEHQSRRA